MSHSKLIPALVVTALAVGMTTAPAPAQAQAQASGTAIIITDVNLTGLNYDAVAGLLTATGGTVTGTFGGLPFTTDVENFVLELLPGGGMGGGACSVLDLELGPIDLDLLGLHVDTSAICLELTAMEGEGILGDLLCGLAGGDLLLLPDLLDVLPDILTETMARQTGQPDEGAEDICDGDCEILDLSLGPVNLFLLGLNVYLHNCEDGPVQVCVSASQGEGLLGNLLCGLAGGGTLIDLGNLLDLIDAIAGLDGLADLDLSPQQIRGLVNQLRNALRDGELSARELERLVRVISRRIGTA
ncbi:MAG TPA: hypothetical protein VGR35_06320 [Tepidisphaeraceae bacterium]|nr:hypothetical protein [Tepidisphaeraceae bacterium]